MVEMTVAQAAAKWKVSISYVHKLVAQGRVKHRAIGGASETRVNQILITQADPPRRDGSKLTPAQREAWPRESVETQRKRRAGKRSASAAK